ncbi:hypothetical protein D3C87_1508300 [compost metagenome]
MRKTLRNRKGQVLIENVLMMIVTIGFLLWATKYLREEKYLAKLISEPWQRIAGMIESGVWEPPKAAQAKHPNQLNRSLALDPRTL